jgi:small subunit ribosomal protein S6
MAFMPLYEHVFIARQDVSQQAAEGLIETFKGVITENGGKVEKTEYWGLKTLTYKIRKNRKGHYALMNIDAPHSAVAEMERQMKLNEDVLRHMTLRVDELEESPSAILQSRGRDDRRGGRDDRRPGGGRPDRGSRDDRPREDRPPREDRKPAAAAPAAPSSEA